jgi:hypothetical protein
MRPDDFLSEDGQRFARFVEQHQTELGDDAAALAAVLDRREEAEFSLRIRQQLQEISALAVKVPVNQAAIKGCAETLRRHREIELVQKRLSELLQGKPVLSAEDREQVRAYQAILRKLKGSGTSEGVQGE